MSDLPDCLQPAVEQIQKYQTQVSALEAKTDSLNEHIQDLSNKNERLVTQVKEDAEAYAVRIEEYEAEKANLRELNSVVGEQLKEKSSLVEELNANKTQLQEEKIKASSENLRVNVEQEVLSQNLESLSNEIEVLKGENAALKDENSALSLVNSAMHQRQEDNKGEKQEDNPVLLAEIERLKQELQAYQNGNTDLAFLQSENIRLTQRHGEITQEKMQASAKMHTAQNALQGVQDKLDAEIKKVEQLNFDLHGLQNLHKNLNDEKNSHLQDNKTLEVEKTDLEKQILHLEENIQRLETEKELLSLELTKEHKKADTLTQVINELRMKNEKLKSAISPSITPVSASVEPEIEALEINDSHEDMIEIVDSSKMGPSFPGEPR